MKPQPPQDVATSGEQDPGTEAPSLRAVMRALAVPVYLPSLLFAVAQNAILIMLPLFALQFDNGAALAAMLLGVRGAGVLLADVPAGMMVSRAGDKWVMVLGQAVLLAVTVAAAFAESGAALLAVALGTGVGGGLWMIGRLAYISDHVVLEQRGRVIAVMAGIQRAGALLGPLIAGLGVQTFGYASTFAALSVLYAVSLVMALLSRHARRAAVGEHPRLLTVVRGHARVFATAGLVTVILQILRNARVWIIPVWGNTLGFDEVTIGLVFSVSSALDMLMFLPAGLLLDHVGRRYAVAPALIIMGLAIALMPTTTGLWSFAACAVLLGLGNGFSTGSVMTLGADFAPEHGRGEFLGVWRLVGDVGTASGPMIIGVLAQLGTVAGASLVTGALGGIGAILLFALVPETLTRSRRRDQRAKG